MRHGAYWQICITLGLSRGGAHEEAVEDDQIFNASRDAEFGDGRCFAAYCPAQTCWRSSEQQERQGATCGKTAKDIAVRTRHGERWVENSPEEEGGFRYRQEARQARTWWVECAGIGGGPNECGRDGGLPYQYSPGQNFSAEFEKFQAPCCSLYSPNGGVECGAARLGGR